MLHIAIAEDENKYTEQLRGYLERYTREHEIEVSVDFYCNGKELIEQFRPLYDIILLDIRMPDMDGMTAAKHIREQDEQVVIVFITNLAQYATKGYEVGALDYLLKPVSYEVFAVKFERAVRRANNRSGGQIILSMPNGLRRIRTRDIYYVEIQNHMLHYHTAEGEVVFRGTMQSAEQLLKNYPFAKCSHWYLVNLFHISEINKNTVTVAGKKLEISRRSKAAFLEAATNYLGGNT